MEAVLLPPLFAQPLRLQLHHVATYAATLVRDTVTVLPLQHILLEVMQHPGKLLASAFIHGQPFQQGDRALWPLHPMIVYACTAPIHPTSTDDIAPWHDIIPVAAACEFLGCSLDIFDDIQDGDDEFVRRIGVPIATDIALAFLALMHHALEGQPATVQRWFARTLLQATSGQFLDLTLPAEPFVSVAQALEMTERKSGSLIGLLYQVGAFCGSLTHMPAAEAEQISTHFERVGSLLGVRAQLRNDLADAYIYPGQTKSDRAQRKKTIPLVIEAEALAAQPHLSPADLARIRTIYGHSLAALLLIQAEGIVDGIEKDQLQQHGTTRHAIMQEGVPLATPNVMCREWIQWLIEVGKNDDRKVQSLRHDT